MCFKKSLGKWYSNIVFKQLWNNNYKKNLLLIIQLTQDTNNFSSQSLVNEALKISSTNTSLFSKSQIKKSQKFIKPEQSQKYIFTR